MRKLGHPAVLEFVLPDGQQRFAALVGTAGSVIELEIGGQVHRFDPMEVLSWWCGQSTLLWKPPVAGVTVLRPGQYSPAVPWLRRQLDPSAGAGRPNPALFDTGLATLVKEFQGAQGLLPDGVAGPQTFICLLKQTAAPEEAEQDVPLLQSMPAEFQAKIPPLKISLHAYFSDPRKRFAVINLNRHEAGEQIADGVRLEAIKADGLIVSYQGTRFRVNRP